MLKITEGGFFSVAYEKLKEEIATLTKSGRQVYLVVPEQQTVTAEKEMAEFLTDSAPVNFEVTNFTRLADTFYRSAGGISGERCDKGKRALLMWKALVELAPFLSITDGRGEINTGLVERALSAVKETESLSIGADELTSLSQNPKIKTNKRLSSKLSDLARIKALYTRLVEEKYSNAKDECERLSEKLAETPDFFSGSVFYFTGFTSFTEPQYKVLTYLIKSADVTVHLTISKLAHDFFEFTEIKATEERLARISDKVGADKKLIRFEETGPNTPPLTYELSNILWKNFGKIDNDSLQNSDVLRIFEAEDTYEECDFVAADIKRQVMAGASYRDFAIVARDAGKYSGIIDASLEKAGIPTFLSKRKDTSALEAVKLIYTAFSVIEGGFIRHDVISYAKCRLCGVSAEECDEFELYLDKWQLGGQDLMRDADFTQSPDGYSQRKSKGFEETLQRLNSIRKKLLAPLIKFKNALALAETVREYAKALFDFLSDISLEEKIAKRERELTLLGETDAAVDNEKIWDIICRALDSAVEVLSNLEINLSGFENLVRILLSNADIGKIPAFYDEVTVGSADMIRLTDKKHIYLIGVNKNEFPRPAEDGSYFTVRERRALSEIGFAADTDEDIAYARELFFFSRAFCSSKKNVTLLYSLRDEAFLQTARADVIDRIISLTDGKIKAEKISDIPINERIYFPDAAFDFSDNGAVRKALVDAGFSDKVKISDGKISNENLKLQKSTLDVLYKGDLALTQTRIDTFVDCPFAYYLRYNVKLSENERAEFDARNIGTFVHAILENFLSEIHDSGKDIRTLNEEEKNRLVKASAKKYLDTLTDENSPTTKRTDVIVDRIFRASMPVVDGICDELRACKFKPRFFELKIGTEEVGMPSPATFKDGYGDKVSVYGSIDRVDTFESGNDVFVRVIDYKTGHKSFSPADIDEGKNLQMFLYLKAIAETDNKAFLEKIGVKEGGRIIPAGVIYVKTDLSDVVIPHADKETEAETIRKKQGRQGMLLNDNESISAMNSEYIPIKFTKKGEIDARYKKYAYTPEEWNEINEKISNKILEISGAMKSGEISPTAKENSAACEWCKFKSVCRKK